MKLIIYCRWCFPLPARLLLHGSLFTESRLVLIFIFFSYFNSEDWFQEWKRIKKKSARKETQQRTVRTEIEHAALYDDPKNWFFAMLERWGLLDIGAVRRTGKERHTSTAAQWQKNWKSKRSRNHHLESCGKSLKPTENLFIPLSLSYPHALLPYP